LRLIDVAIAAIGVAVLLGLGLAAQFARQEFYAFGIHAVLGLLFRLRKRVRAMVTEIAQIDVKPGMEAEFEAGVKNAAPVFKRAKGCRSMELQRSIEKPSRYRLFVGWETVENHTVDFRSSGDFQEWRKLVGHCFASPPEVEHVTQAVKGF
jgi:heme-degrading monooxygenase HmoA